MPDDLEDRSGPRPFWAGTISFGLVSVPVSLFPANRSGGIALRMLAEDGTPLERRFYCPKDECEVDRKHIVRGYELDSGKHVVVTDEELEALAPKKSRDIDLERFVEYEAIDPLYFERSYFLAPAGNSTKAYRLLADALEDGGRAGIGTFVMRDKEYWVAILAERGILRAETLRFPEEIRSPAITGPDDLPKPKKSDIERFEKIISKHTAKKLDEDELVDRKTERLLELVERKRKAGRGVVRTPEDSSTQAEDNVIDLMRALQERMRASAKSKGDDRARKPRKASSRGRKPSRKPPQRHRARASNG